MAGIGSIIKKIFGSKAERDWKFLHFYSLILIYISLLLYTLEYF
jgi:hypothetical protein